MNSSVLRRAALFSVGLASAVFAQSPIIISDGPTPASHSSPLSSSRSPIITTDGPSTLPYQYPLPIVTTDGPAELFYNRQAQVRSGKIVVSDGPGTTRTISKTDASLDPQTSALAPALAGNNILTAHPASIQPATAMTPAFHKKTSVTREEDAFYIYSDKQNSGNHFVPSGWMGDYQDLKIDESSHTNPHSGSTCIQITYKGKGSQGNGWAGIYWQYPANNWGDKPGGYDLTGRRRLTFWAHGEKGGEVISDFKMGGISGEKGDSAAAGTGSIVLTQGWKKYTMGLGDLDLSHIIGGFSWTASRADNPNGMVFYLDDIRYE